MSHNRKIGKPVIKPRGAGFQARVRVGGLGGKPKDFYGHGPTEHEAVAAATKQAHAFDPGLVTADGGISFVAYLRDFHANNEKLKPRTRASYLTRIALHVEPVLGSIPINRLTWGDFQRLKTTLTKGGSGGNTVLGVFRMLSKPMELAVKRRMLKENLLLTITLPSGVAEERTPLTHAQLLHLLELVKDSYWEDHVHIFAATGMRLAELLGLEWRDLQLDDAEPHLNVRQIAHDKKDGIAAGFGPPKSRAGRRRIDLSPESVERLRARWERRLRPRPDQLVFPNRAGLQQDGATLRHFLKNRARMIGVDKLYPHLLRHTMISHALQLTGDLGGVSAMAGHSNPKITAGIYLKGLPGAGRKIAAAMGTLISGREGACGVQIEGASPILSK